ERNRGVLSPPETTRTPGVARPLSRGRNSVRRVDRGGASLRESDIERLGRRDLPGSGRGRGDPTASSLGAARPDRPIPDGRSRCRHRGRGSGGLALGIFGTVLIVLGLIQHLLLRRDLQHWPDQVVLREDGVELFLRNGEVRGLSWADSDLALNLVSRKAPPPVHREYLLVWMSDPKIPSIELSADGYSRLKSAAETQRLVVTVNRPGRDQAGTE